MNRTLLNRLTSQASWRRHFLIVNLTLIIVIGIYNLLTRWIPLVHLGWLTSLALIIVIDLVCVWGQILALEATDR